MRLLATGQLAVNDSSGEETRVILSAISAWFKCFESLKTRNGAKKLYVMIVLSSLVEIRRFALDDEFQIFPNQN
jgi:hypothetical protein